MAGELVQTPQTLWRDGAYQSAQRGSRVILVADVVNGVGESRYSALRVPGAAGGYQVTAGKTLHLTKVRFVSTANAARWLILSGTADAGDSQVAAPAGAKSENSRAVSVSGALDVLTANNPVEFDLYCQVASGLFPAIRCLSQNTTLTVLIVGHEE